jgi:hypothetical protein
MAMTEARTKAEWLTAINAIQPGEEVRLVVPALVGAIDLDAEQAPELDTDQSRVLLRADVPVEPGQVVVVFAECYGALAQVIAKDAFRVDRLGAAFERRGVSYRYGYGRRLGCVYQRRVA